MPRLAQEIFSDLLAHYGPQGWWPGESSFEIAIGAILTQNTAWKNVERALEALREEGWLTPASLANVDVDLLGETIRAAGYYRQKARRLQSFARFLVEEFGGELSALFAQGVRCARDKLLGLHGIGPETADSILLYAGHLPSFVVDTYTARIIKRHGWIDSEADYHDLQDWFISQLPDNVPMWNEFHALLVKVGKDHCKPRVKCDGCPLQYRLTRPIEECHD